MKGKIPATKEIVLASNTEQWTLIEKGLINEFKCSGIIQRNPESKINIHVTLTSVIGPSNYRWENIVNIEGDITKQMKCGFERINEFFSNFCNRSVWILSGHINGNNKLPILILHYEIFNLSIYTLKFKRESYLDFLPDGVLPPKN